ncbi:MAG: YIP1 family protein [Oligoflexia bacterium]|nr:YIP1 family protein [Oligoflexia bacterium]
MNFAQDLGSTNSSNSTSGGSSNGGPIDWQWLIARSKAILFNPTTVWQDLKNDSMGIPELYKRWILPMAGLPALCGFLGLVIFGKHVPFIGTFRPGIVSAFGGQLMAFVMSLVGAYLFAFIADKLAPKFEGSTNLVSCLKMVAFAATPSYIAGLFNILPSLGINGLLALVGGLYGLYLIWNAIPVMTGVPEAKRLPYFAVTIVVSIIAGIVLSVLFAIVTPSTNPPPVSFKTDNGEIDLNKIQEGLKQFEKMIPQAHE